MSKILVALPSTAYTSSLLLYACRETRTSDHDLWNNTLACTDLVVGHEISTNLLEVDR
jgi:hypothetical protein